MENKFNLKKLQLLKGGVKITFITEHTKDGSVYYKETTEKMAVEPHPDLVSAVTDLAVINTELLGLPDTGEMVVNGLMISGTAEKSKVKIKGIFNMAELQTVIYYKAGLYDNENKTAKLLDEVEKEAYEYIFNDKRAQLSLAFESDED